jgi:hypothetical protein
MLVMSSSSGRCISYQDLVEEILNELLLKRARGEEAVQVGTQEFGN